MATDGSPPKCDREIMRDGKAVLVTHSVIATGPLPNDFANDIAACIDRAQERGIDLDVAACIAIGVAADYARAEYGDQYLEAMAYVIKQRAGKPLPRPGGSTDKNDG